ncbi:MAG TPA: 3-octaprenyl-4-hydroxybenzoate carboxy-lyase [Porticoccaceae bacterium]|nr:3-octaprenyl-4-hydroxybenzoate carboxy-lyase [Porticoccaceae bacterium]HCO58604.1 3-octaprenyl-4-hydroxybenzoate carboxy-lyase [Porticoccaceae bacterium]
MTTPLIIAITGATGVIYGIRLLEVLAPVRDIETHLLISPAGILTAQQETTYGKAEIEALADVVHPHRDISASIASGSFLTAGMVVAPCSMNTLSAIATGLDNNLVTRAAGVTLKERRKLVLLTRETPLNLAHLRNMTAVTEMGGIITPPVPSFYNNPQNIDDIVDQTVGRTLDHLGIETMLVKRWQGLPEPSKPSSGA